MNELVFLGYSLGTYEDWLDYADHDIWTDFFPNVDLQKGLGLNNRLYYRLIINRETGECTVQDWDNEIEEEVTVLVFSWHSMVCRCAI